MDGKEAARWLALFAVLVVGYFAYDKLIVGGNKAFGITRSMKGEMITIRAEVVSISSGKGHLFPVLRDPDNRKMIQGVLFKNDAAPEECQRQRKLLEARLADGDPIEIDGKVDVYNDELKIIIVRAH